MAPERLIGNKPNQISLNAMLGRMAFADPASLPPLASTEIGTATIGTATIGTATIGLDSGTESAPSLYFSEDVTLGAYRLSTGGWGFVVGGLTQLRITDATAPLEERYTTAFFPLVSAVDIGDGWDEISLNGDLGLLAFENEVSKLRPSGSTPINNLDINFEYVSDTSLKIRMRGADGVLRSATLTLA